MKEVKQQFQTDILDRIEEDDLNGIDAFETFDKDQIDFYDYIELTHEYLDKLAFKLRESKSKLNKEYLAKYIFEFFKKTIKKYDFNEKFIASQGKTLVTYYKNQKNLDKAIEILEFLIFHGITENSGPGFHMQLDDLYRLRIKRQNREIRMDD